MGNFTQRHKELTLHHGAELQKWARDLKKEYGPQLDYFLKNGSPVEQKLAQRVIELSEEATA